MADLWGLSLIVRAFKCSTFHSEVVVWLPKSQQNLAASLADKLRHLKAVLVILVSKEVFGEAWPTSFSLVVVIGNQVIVDEDSISKFFYIRKKLLLGIKIPRHEPLESLYKKAFNSAFNKNCSLAMRKLTVSSSALLKEVTFGKVNGTNRLHTQGRIEQFVHVYK